MDSKQIFDLKVNYVTLGGMINRRATISKSHWEKLYNLEKTREDNTKLYTTEYVKKWLLDDRYQELFADNRLFVATQSLVAFVASRISEPEVIPSDGKDLSIQFARDFEKVLFEEADDLNGTEKVKLSIQDLLTGQRVGVLKLVYNAKKKKIELKYVNPKSIIIGKRAKLHEELDFIQEHQIRSIGELITQFPDMRDKIFQLFNIQKGVPSQLEREIVINETHLFMDDENGENKLAIAWSYQNTVFGAMADPLFDTEGDNVIDEPMIPYILFNFLNDGSGYIDHTSLIEQAQYSQKNYDKRGMTIEENAAYAGIGVPVFGKGAIKEETAAKVRFSPVQRIMLDTEDVGKGFTTWNGGQLQNFVIEDKLDLRNNVDNMYGVNSLITGQMAQSKTAAQDAMLRDQAQGRQQTLVNCVETGMVRFYQLLAQFIYRYFDEEKYYGFLGEDGKFESVMISQQKLRQNFGVRIRVKAGTSYPIDRTQKRQVALSLMAAKKIGTLRLYKELGIEKPEEAYHEYLQENLLPFAQLEESNKSIESREAEQDLAIVIGGQVPDEREDIEDDYIAYLNEYLLTNKYHQLPQDAQQRVSVFVSEVIAQSQRKLLKLSTQQQTTNPAKLMPPIRPKISITGRDVQPDVLAQIIENAGYQASALTPVEMAAGLVTPPQERMNVNALNPKQQAPTTK